MTSPPSPLSYPPLGCEVARRDRATPGANAGGFAQRGMVRKDPAPQAATARRFAVNLIPAATEPALLDRKIGGGGAWRIQCGRAFPGTPDPVTHDHHKGREVADTRRNEDGVPKRPADTAVGAIAKPATRPFGVSPMGHDPDRPPRRPIAHNSTKAPRRATTGDPEAMALHAGQSGAAIDALIPAAGHRRRIMAEAEAMLAALVRAP